MPDVLLARVRQSQQGQDGGRAPGRMVHVDPLKLTLKAPGSKRLKLKYDLLLSSVAFNFNLHRYTLAILAPGPGDHVQGDSAASTLNPPPTLPPPPPPPPLRASHHMYYGDRVMDVPAGGLLRTSTRPCVCSDEARPRVCMCIAPEG